MTSFLHSNDPDFTARLEALLASRQGTVGDVAPVVGEMIAAVRARGDAALVEYTQRFDRLTLHTHHSPLGGESVGGKITSHCPPTGLQEQSPLPPAKEEAGADHHTGASLPHGTFGLRITPAEMAAAQAQCDPAVVAALTVAAERIRTYHAEQLPQAHRTTDAQGVTLGWQYAPLASVGLYVPGGKASYPSSVLMNAIPARVAGVERVVMVVPTPDGVMNPAVLVAAQLAGVDEIYRIGGAQAVAALAYGTASIAPVVKIVGPGNAYVAEAKRQVYGQVGIDTIAGPSEILVVADAKNDPSWIAADLLSQAEHDEMAQAILITNDAQFAQAVMAEIARLLDYFPKPMARASWERFGAVIQVAHWAEILPIIAQIAPEHLELAIDDAEALAPRIRGAGAIFLGRHTPEAFGDYLAGPSHVLPTSRAARFSSGLSVFDFLNRTSIIGVPASIPQALFEAAATLADAEGLPAHALSLRLRAR